MNEHLLHRLVVPPYHIPLSASQINDIDMAFSVHLQHICTFIVRHIYQSG